MDKQWQKNELPKEDKTTPNENRKNEETKLPTPPISPEESTEEYPEVTSP